MAKINLLPWRQERRQQRQKEFYTLLGASAVLGLILSYSVVAYFNGLIENQNKRNTLLANEISALEIKIKEIEDLEKQRADLLQRKQVIEELQASRSQMVHLFDQLVRTIPDGVRLNSVKQAGDKLTLSGIAQSNARVSSYMRLIEQSGWMTQPDLSVIEAKGTDRSMPYQFSLSLKLTQPKKPEQEGAAAVSMAGGG